MIYFKPDTNQLQAIAKLNREKYTTAAPFPHIYLDNVFPDLALETILEEFPTTKQAHWQQFNNNKEVKLAAKNEQDFGDFTRHFIHMLNSRSFIDFLETLTGIPGLLPDPYLEGGGLHMIKRGGMLKVHADFNKHPNTGLDRRLNVLIYLNKEWEESYGGHLELWDKNMEKSMVKILPIYNRMAIFSTTSHSYHGHPDPLMCPENRTRKSIALYYYTNGRPLEEATASHNTIFKLRKEDAKSTLKQTLRDWIPPVLLRTFTK
ncbi:2OG-Fe(II) oxygenase [Chitinophaga sancti]|uniref:2OG-Fe(II) oxygenase n=1 Tax=Chitinophaga sancti TaxID=1004 RepID=UPI002A75FE2F|nr:2OG-Fe(II) oxygenase [Chitinophaga sancti]WPQ62114.1 2OG-Fe(II) oxygenase [Chitinophaga sancti]